MNLFKKILIHNIGVGCSYQYDRFGNRWKQQPYGTGTCYSDIKTYTMNGAGTNNNQMDGANLYDAVGNMRSNPNVTGSAYTYDAESRLIISGTYSYIYDAEGRRVAKKNGGVITAEYLFDNAGGQQIELDGAGNTVHTNVSALGRIIATYQGTQTQFQFADWLGGRRLQVNALGAVSSGTIQKMGGNAFSRHCKCSRNIPQVHWLPTTRWTDDHFKYYGKCSS